MPGHPSFQASSSEIVSAAKESVANKAGNVPIKMEMQHRIVIPQSRYLDATGSLHLHHSTPSKTPDRSRAGKT